MRRFVTLVLVGLVCGGLGVSRGSADSSEEKDAPPPLHIGDLTPSLDGKVVTVRFTITAVDGIAQLTKPGQALSFHIEADKGTQKNRLAVWIEGELANVLDRLQMSYLQSNELKAGTTIVGRGKLQVHKLDPHLFFLSITQWQDFRILPTKKVPSDQ